MWLYCRNKVSNFYNVIQQHIQLDVWYTLYNPLSNGARNKKGWLTKMKNEIMIKITLTDDNITLDGEHIQELTKDDVIDSISVLVTLANILNIIGEGDFTNGNS